VLELLFDLSLALRDGLLRIPNLFEIRELGLELVDLRLEVREPPFRRFVLFLLSASRSILS
jgi:hypothetical protein